jgi:AcrR family transcriptional regulator
MRAVATVGLKGGPLTQTAKAGRRALLNRDRVLRAAVTLADEAGIDAVSMRNLAQELGVVPMALYKHVANKDELIDGMVDHVVGEIDPPVNDTDWKSAVRQRIVSARRALLRHPWAFRVIASRTSPTPAVLDYTDSMIGMFRAGGFSVELTHHAMHALGRRMWGFTWELFDDSASLDAEAHEATRRGMAGRYPHIAEIAMTVTHDGASASRARCDEQFEFEFALDLLLDGFERLREQRWTPADQRNRLRPLERQTAEQA